LFSFVCAKRLNIPFYTGPCPGCCFLPGVVSSGGLGRLQTNILLLPTTEGLLADPHLQITAATGTPSSAASARQRSAPQKIASSSCKIPFQILPRTDICSGSNLPEPSVASESMVFHCNESISSDVLAPLKVRGATIASGHPVKSFADASLAIKTFPGTLCGLEGDPTAVQVLTEAVGAIGGKVFAIDPSSKAHIPRWKRLLE
jgi:hypothetical protein